MLCYYMWLSSWLTAYRFDTTATVPIILPTRTVVARSFSHTAGHRPHNHIGFLLGSQPIAVKGPFVVLFCELKVEPAEKLHGELRHLYHRQMPTDARS